MAFYDDIKFNNQDGWADIHTTASIAAGTTVYIQNKGPGSILVFEGAAAPTTKTGVVVHPNLTGQSFQTLVKSEPGGTDKTFVKVTGTPSTAVISVQD